MKEWLEAGEDMTKDESNIVKSVAILCMLFHHLFYKASVFRAFKLSGLLYDVNFTIAVAKNLKVCVAIFALMSGYGMTMKLNGTRQKERVSIKWYFCNAVKSYFGLIKDTCFLIIITALLSFILSLPKQPEAIWGGGITNLIKGITANMFGVAGFLKIEWFISPWWYLKVAILFIVIFPFVYLLQKHWIGKIGLVAGYILAICFLMVKPYNDNIWRYLPAFFVGIEMAEWKIPEELKMLIINKWRRLLAVVISIFIFAITVYLKYSIGHLNYIFQTIQAVVILIVSLVLLSKIPYLAQMLACLGKNSKYMWLIHAYIYNQLIRNFMYSLGNIWLIFVTLTVISLIASIGLKYANDLISRCIGRGFKVSTK